MAALFNKWLMFSVIPLVLGNSAHFDTKKGETSALRDIHPFHVSVTEIDHNAAEKTLEISCKLFTDDFEKAVTNSFKTTVDLMKPVNKAAQDKYIDGYIHKNLAISVDGKPVTYTFVGWENEGEATYAFFQVDNISKVSKLTLTNTLMYDLFTDQSGIIHVTIGGNRKSAKLDHPGKEASFSF